MKNIALLIDLENISPQIIDQAIQQLQPFGQLIIKRAYGDLSKASTALSQWKEVCLAHNIEVIHHFSCKTNKNSSDIRLTIDAIDILHQQSIELFCILSNDSDFGSLIQRLKQAQCEVIGMSNNSPNEIYTKLFHQFFQLSPANNAPSATKAEEFKSKTSLSLLASAVKSVSDIFNKPSSKPTHEQSNKATSANLNPEQQLIKTVYKKVKKNSEGYVLQSIFASDLTPAQKKFIKEKYKTFGKFVIESPYLSIKTHEKCATQHWIKPNFKMT